MSAVIHLLDVGDKPYGDCALIEFGTDTKTLVLIDGGHRSDRARILSQLASIVGHQAPFAIDLVIISHAHDDHVGALPELIGAGELTVAHALIPGIDVAFGPAGLDAAVPGAVTQVLALLREEPPEDGIDATSIEALALDAGALRDRYTTMVDALNESDCHVVSFGSDPAARIRALEHTFSGIGLKVLGPSQRALERSSELLFAGATDAAADAVAFVADGLDTVDLMESLDASKRLGHLVNAQSIVCTFNATPGADRRILFGGDFQFADLDTSDPVLTAERDRILGRITAAAPYAFAKLSHHGSDNAVGARFLDAIGDTSVVGIICGHGHPAHPDPETLELLDQRGEPSWVRTDRSGHIKIHVTEHSVKVRPASARNISDVNEPDAPPQELTKVVTPPPPAPPTPRAAIPSAAGNERITVEIPPRTTSVTIRLDLDPADAAPGSQQMAIATGASTAAIARPEVTTAGARAAQPSRQHSPAADKRFEIAAGRAVGRLLFLTDTAVLADHLGANVVSIISAAINAGGHHLCDIAPARANAVLSVDDIAELLLADISAVSPTQVVILGGYDVVPAEQIDTIAPETPEAAVKAQRKWDPDGFVVWSDDTYVDFEGAGLPDLPISRIPDAHDALFTLNALQAAPRTDPTRNGVRNSRREFVTSIFATLPGTAPLLVSGPTKAADVDRDQLQGSLVYYMLHGSDSDGKKFWGEASPGRLVEAITLTNLPTSGVDIAVLGCCWGALPASSKATDWAPGQPISGRLVNQSIALSLLAAGARAVIGCTGAHYSPTRPPYTTNAGPLHLALWQRLRDGQPPASALFDAKYDFAAHVATVTDANELAICNKTLSQFTCLGLGC